MAIKKIITDEELLKIKSADIDFDSPATQGIVDNLLDTAEEHRNDKAACVGLAANQLGSYVRIFVIKIDNWFEPIINPKVVKKGGRLIKMKETCLSRPNQPPIVKARFQRITLEYTSLEGKIVKKTFHNFSARIVQHELDHFKGRLV